MDAEIHFQTTPRLAKGPEPMNSLSDSKVAHPYLVMDQLEDSGMQSQRHQRLQNIVTAHRSLNSVNAGTNPGWCGRDTVSKEPWSQETVLRRQPMEVYGRPIPIQTWQRTESKLWSHRSCWGSIHSRPSLAAAAAAGEASPSPRGVGLQSCHH